MRIYRPNVIRITLVSFLVTQRVFSVSSFSETLTPNRECAVYTVYSISEPGRRGGEEEEEEKRRGGEWGRGCVVSCF